MGSKFDRGDQSEQEGQPTLEKQVNNGEQQLNGDETGAGLNRLMWTRLMTILKPFFLSSEGWKAYLLLGLLMAFSFSINGLNIISSYLNRDLMTFLAQGDAGKSYFLAFQSAAVFLVITAFAVLFRYTEERFGLFWREWLTQYFFRSYLSRRAYSWLNSRTDIDNPDQRIAEDIRNFCTTTLSFFLIILNSAVSFVAFTSVLWSITPMLVYGALVYAIMGSVITYMVGYKLIRLNFLQLKKEADLRYDLIQVREHADSIALNRGEGKELHRLQRGLLIVVENLKKIISVNRNLGFFTTGYNYWAQLVPVLIVAPHYLQGHHQFGVVTQAVSAFAFVLGSFSLMVTEFQRISSFVAVISRLGTLTEALQSEPSFKRPTIKVEEGSSSIVYEHVTLHRPEDHIPLILDLSMEIKQGQRLAIVGPNRTGKSLLVKATAGIRMVGKGRIRRPSPQNIMFLMQNPYYSRGTLRDLLTNDGMVKDVTEERLLETVKTAKLESLMKRIGGFDTQQDWSATVSTSELQLLAFAELLVASPPFAYLDEALSAICRETRLQLYAALKDTKITYVSTSGDLELLPFHDQVLEFLADGQWSFHPVDRWDPKK